MSDCVLDVDGVSKSFLVAGKKIDAVRSACLHVGARESVGLVGESGCGKSTLARLITRLDEPDEGAIILCGEDITHLSGTSLRRSYINVKIIFQEPRSSFDPRLTLGTSIREALKAAGLSKPEQTKQTERLLCEVGLDKTYADARPTDVSGGECQRAAIARAIAAKPRLLICDEATSALDVSVQAQIMELLRDLGSKHEMSFLLISHDLALVSSFCDRTYVMHDGLIVEHGETAQIITDPQNEYTRRLISSVLPTE